MLLSPRPEQEASLTLGIFWATELELPALVDSVRAWSTCCAWASEAGRMEEEGREAWGPHEEDRALSHGLKRQAGC